jgi:hypothetical protein
MMMMKRYKIQFSRSSSEEVFSVTMTTANVRAAAVGTFTKEQY